MKLLTNYFFLLCVFSGLIFTSCSNDDDDKPADDDETYLLSQFDVTFADLVRRPLFELNYGSDGKLSAAKYYYYNTGENPDEPEKTELDATITYQFTRTEKEIVVNCSYLNNKTANNKVENWIVKLTLNNGQIISAHNLDNEGETTLYTWKDGKLQNVYGYDFTYKGDDIDNMISQQSDTNEDDIYETKCVYELTCNNGKTNPFTIIPFELLAVTGDNIDVFPYALCNNEITKIVHTDFYSRRNENKVFYETSSAVISDYTYKFNENNLMSSATLKETSHDIRIDYENPEYNNDEISDAGSYTIHFEYIKKGK